MFGPQAVQQRASEAEEDQQRAEQQALAAVAELRQLQLQHQQTWQPADDSQQPSNLSAAPGPCLFQPQAIFCLCMHMRNIRQCLMIEKVLCMKSTQKISKIWCVIQCRCRSGAPS